MNVDILKDAVGSGTVGKEIILFDEIDSTNIYAKSIAKKASHGTVVIAERQNLGKGRHGKSWVSPSGVGIWMSIILKPDADIESIVKIPSLISLAVSSGIESSTGLDTLIKWPNDIIIGNKKVSGILIESLTQNNMVEHIIAGIGVNVNQDEEFFEEMPWSTSISIQKGHKLNREEIVASILHEVESYYNDFLNTKSLNLDELSKRSVLKGKTVRVLFENEELLGEVTGFKEDGSILIKSKGRIININSLKVSIRGLNGYID